MWFSWPIKFTKLGAQIVSKILGYDKKNVKSMNMSKRCPRVVNSQVNKEVSYEVPLDLHAL